MKKNYTYTKHNLLKNPEYYMYSDYNGKDFLKTYLNHRNLCIKYIKKKIKLKEISLRLIYENIIKKKNYNTQNNIYTKELLISVFQKIYIKKTMDNNDFNILNILIKKFEVKKKIYEYYSFDFKNNIGKDNDLFLYAILSLILILLYQQTENYKYLNTVLKLNDILCSVKSYIKTNINKYLTINVLTNEIIIINKILKEKNIIL